MIGCPECGRPLEPYEITAYGETWMQGPTCYHDDTEEVRGVEMTFEQALERAIGMHDHYMDEADEMAFIIEEIKEMKHDDEGE